MSDLNEQLVITRKPFAAWKKADAAWICVFSRSECQPGDRLTNDEFEKLFPVNRQCATAN